MSLSHRRAWIGVLAVALALGATLAVAELADVYLKSGLRLRGDVTTTETEVVVRNELGETRFPKDQVERVVPLAETQPAPATAPVTQPVTQPSSRPTTQPESQPASLPAGQPEGAAPVLPAPPLLSLLDIQRLKMSELRVDGPAEKLRVKFAGKDQQELPRKILQELSLRPDFRKEWEDVLQRGQAGEKLQLIVRLTGTKYADRVTIADDPAVFATYRAQVLPVVVRNCAQSGCHSGDAAVKFRFPNGSTSSETYAYTTFVLLDRTETSQGPLFNRVDPEGSALLGYLLAEKGNLRAHPPVEGKRRFTAVLRNKDNPLYRRISEWIDSLASPRPRYGLDYAFPPQPPQTQPAQSQPTETQPASQPSAPAP